MIRLWILALWLGASLPAPALDCATAFARLPSRVDPVPERARWIAHNPDFRATLSEIGAAQRVAGALGAQGVRFPLLAITPYDRGASDHRYGRAGAGHDPRHYISLKRLWRQLAVEYDRIPPEPGRMRFVLADTAATNRRDGEAWMGFVGQLRPDGAPVAVLIHVRLFEEAASLQKETLGRLGVNLIYSLYREAETPPAFLRSLTAGIPRGALSVDAVRVSGLAELDPLNGGTPLLEAGLTPYVLFDPRGATVSPVSLRGRPEFADPDRLPAGWRVALVNAEPAEPFRQAFVPPPPRPRGRRPLTLADEVKDAPEWKARHLNTFSGAKGVVVEAGGAGIATRIFEAPFGGTLFEALHFNTAREAQLRYGAAEARVAPERVKTILDRELPRVHYHRPHRKFALASLVEERAGVWHGWVGIAGQTEVGGPVSRVVLHVVLGGDGKTREKTLGSLGVNLLYAFYYHRENPDRFFDSLREGIEPDRFTIDAAELEGAEVEWLGAYRLPLRH